MPDKKTPDRRDDRGRREGEGPSVFPRGPGERRSGEHRDPEEEGSAGKTPQ